MPSEPVPSGLFEAAAWARKNSFGKCYTAVEAGDHHVAIHCNKTGYKVIWFHDPAPRVRTQRFRVVAEQDYPYEDLFAGSRAWQAYQQTLHAMSALVALEVFDLPAPLPTKKETKR